MAIGDKWRAQIRRKGHPSLTQTFLTKDEAVAWAGLTEPAVIAGTHIDTQVLLGATIDRYLNEDISMGRSKADALRQVKKGLGHRRLGDLTVYDVVSYVRSRGYSGATARVEMSALKMTLKVAALMWGYKAPDIMDEVCETLALAGLYGSSARRTRRPTSEELERLCAWFDAKNTKLPMRDLIWFSVHSAMRVSEVTRIRWADYDPTARTVIIRDRKDPRNKAGNDQEVPLLDEAIAIIERQDTRSGEFIFPYSRETIGTIFPQACTALGIKDLHWHDLRHEGTSRLFEKGYQIHEVAMFTGHKDWAMLRRYTHLRPKEIRRLPAAETPAAG
jgi:integrase